LFGQKSADNELTK